MLGVLSEGTIQHFEKNVFTDPKGAVQNWEEFTLAYGSMHISKFVSDVLMDEDRAVVKDPGRRNPEMRSRRHGMESRPHP